MGVECLCVCCCMFVCVSKCVGVCVGVSVCVCVCVFPWPEIFVHFFQSFFLPLLSNMKKRFFFIKHKVALSNFSAQARNTHTHTHTHTQTHTHTNTHTHKHTHTHTHTYIHTIYPHIMASITDTLLAFINYQKNQIRIWGPNKMYCSPERRPVIPQYHCFIIIIIIIIFNTMTIFIIFIINKYI